MNQSQPMTEVSVREMLEAAGKRVDEVVDVALLRDGVYSVLPTGC